MTRAEVEIINKLGLHARAASKLVALTGRYGARISIGRPGQKLADGKSIMAMLMLAANKGTRLAIECEGDDEQALCDEVCALIANRFDEGE